MWVIYEYWFARMKNISDNKKKKLREAYGSAKEIYYIEETKLDKLRFLNEKDVAILKNAKKDTELEEKWRRTEEKRIQFIPYFLKTYPEKLKYITDPPYALYVLGQLPDEKRKSAAIVGARNCTAYGEQMALQYGKSLAEAGIQIISGMARGIDGAGQRGALNSSWAYQDTYVSNNQQGRFYFEGGILRGNTDYLCGKGDVYYNNVDLVMCGTGYLAVPSQPTKYGYIFKDCTIKDGTTTGINGKYKLGRPWGKGTPIALFIDTKMEVIPTAAGWDEMSGGYPKRFAEYNSTTTTGSAVDLSGRKQVYDAYDAKDGDNYTNRRNETAESPVLTAEEAAFYTVETVMGADDDWDPTAATEQASAPTNVKMTGSNLTWDNSNYALLWAVCKNGKVVDFTVEPTYNVDDASATWSVRAANEMGGLGEATVASTSTGIENIATSADVLSTKIYSADGVQVSKLQRGINIVVKTMADGSKKTSKVVLK